jgi:hypothetical protein
MAADRSAYSPHSLGRAAASKDVALGEEDGERDRTSVGISSKTSEPCNIDNHGNLGRPDASGKLSCGSGSETSNKNSSHTSTTSSSS